MSIILFSSDFYEKGRQLSEKTAETLGYKYAGREILSKVAEKYDMAEAKLTRALDETPSFMGMSSKAWKLYLAFIQEAALGEFLDDDVVCHGLAAHLYVLGVSHVLKIRILMDPDERAGQVVDQERVPLEKARKIVQRQDKQRRKWSLDAFNQDETDPGLYDTVINISQIDPEEAVEMITAATGYRKFKPMTYSVKCLQDRELAARVRAALLKNFPDVRVQARDGAVVVEIKALKREKRRKTEAVKAVVGKISGVHYVEVHVINDIFRQAAESAR